MRGEVKKKNAPKKRRERVKKAKKGWEEEKSAPR
jgi:hypothetical protein